MQEIGHVDAPGSSARAPWRSFARGIGILFLLLASCAAGALLHLGSVLTGQNNPFGAIVTGVNLLTNPEQYFPGQDHITVLCLGLDRNIFISKTNRKLNGAFYTKGARSDAMMVADLDLAHHRASVLSIPRDTRIQLPGRRAWSKINEAHARGGVPYTIETVEQFLGVHVDHYVVIKQEAIAAVVNTLGGIPVHVEKDMDYDDNWGHLHVHLKAGDQVLNGEDAVGYMRFRHDKEGEGDFGRMRRQQEVIHVLAQQIKNPRNWSKAEPLINTIRDRRYLDTDFTPTQELALAQIFKGLDPSRIRTATLPSHPETIDGISYVVVDDDRKDAAVDWALRGNEAAMNRLIRVELKNASGSPELYQRVYRALRHDGFEVWRAGRAPIGPIATSRVVQRTTLQGSGRRVLDDLGVRGSVERSHEHGADVTLFVGKDLESAPPVTLAADLPDLPDWHPERAVRTTLVRRPRFRPAVSITETPKDEPRADEDNGGDQGAPEPDAGAPASHGNPAPGSLPNSSAPTDSAPAPAPPSTAKPPADKPVDRAPEPAPAPASAPSDGQ